MELKGVSRSLELSEGRTIEIETGKLARQADGSALVRMGDTVLLATVVAAKTVQESPDFFPLSVDYQEKFASTGRIPGGFLRREGRLSDHEILISRLVDRCLRPLFPEDYFVSTQVQITLFSSDGKVAPNGLAGLAASAALSVSDLPFQGPISEVRLARVGQEFVVNPTYEELAKSDLDLVVGASKESITMVEGEAKEVQEDVLLEGLTVAHEAIRKQCALQDELVKAFGKKPTRVYPVPPSDETLSKKVSTLLYDKFYEVAAKQIADKDARSTAFAEVKEEGFSQLAEEEQGSGLFEKYAKRTQKEAVRAHMLKSERRLDGRALDEVRPLHTEASYLPVPHGSALFVRGETQALATVTLGNKMDEQMVDGALVSGTSKLMLHYNFPAFSTGEVKPNRGPSRREVGHANLALRAIRAVMPSGEENPYTIRVVSDILESNGSSSMATVCAGSMALMDAGIQLKNAVSGIAMGMISDEKTGKSIILSDILGDEDHLGDMDFKVAGTEHGITACQMDIKMKGLSYERLKQALMQAQKGRLHILDAMAKAIPKARGDYKAHAPRSKVLRIDKSMIGAVIGPGGKVIQEIQRETGATLSVDEDQTHGVVQIFSADKEAMDKAYDWIEGIVTVPEVGKVYDGKVVSIMPYGAFVEFLPGKSGLLHISEIMWERIEDMNKVFSVGETVKIKILEIDKKTGKFRLSRKVLLPNPAKNSADGGE